jgi:hypothetical protein
MEKEGLLESYEATGDELLEREGRLPEAVEAWRLIIERCDERGWELTTAWPTSELARLRGRQTGGAPLA